MIRYMSRYIALVLSVIVCSPALVARAQDLSKVEVTSSPVAGNVYMLQGSGGNIGVSAGADGILIVDDEFAPLADKIRVALKKLGDRKLRYVLNTHWHGDHTGANAQFGAEAPIIAHDNVRKRLSGELKPASGSANPAPKEALPVITFDDHDLKTFHAMLAETIGLLRQRMKAGKTLDQIQVEGLPETWNSWGAGFVNTKTWINIVFQSLSKPR